MKGMQRSLSRIDPQTSPVVQKKTFRLKAVAINVPNNPGANGFGTVVVGALPTGIFLFLGLVAKVTVTSADTDLTTTYGGFMSMGTDPVAAATEPMAASRRDLTAEAVMGPAVARAVAETKMLSSASLMAMIDNSAGDKEINFNMLIADADQAGNADLVINGTVELAYVLMT